MHVCVHTYVRTCVSIYVRVCVPMCVGVLTPLWLAVARRDPYGVSKKTIDLTAIQLNKELSEKVSNNFNIFM